MSYHEGDHATPPRHDYEPRPSATPGPAPLSSSPNASSGPSPLQLFVKAKKKINEIYNELGDYVTSSQRFLASTSTDLGSSGVPTHGDVGGLSEKAEKRAQEYERKVEAIREVLRRDHMKVVFFGRTSNGKSTAINALLGDRILPTGIGHTTSCFLQVEGGAEGDAFLMTEGSDEKKSVKSLSQLGNALCAEKLDPSSKVVLF